MWDSEIIRDYGARGTSNGYLAFLRRAQSLVREVVKQKAEALGCGLEEAAVLSEEHGGRALTKLVDEYNRWRAWKAPPSTSGSSSP